jgi:hypothetical protein
MRNRYADRQERWAIEIVEAQELFTSGIQNNFGQKSNQIPQ